MKSKLVYALLVLFAVAIMLMVITKEPKISEQFGDETIDISDVLSNNKTETSFKRAFKPVTFSFPTDHGLHREFQTEWWYFTGNLKDSNKNHFGYQLTFFRRAISKGHKRDDSDWRANAIYFAHFAITDVKNKKYYSFEKWSRDKHELAGAEKGILNVWIDDWQAKLDGNNHYVLSSESDNKSISLILKPSKKIALNGNRGLSQKSKEAGNASYYYSHTRLDTEGQIVIDGKKYFVRGESWFDHEWSTSALGKDQKGWDWFSLQLDNSTEVMIYMLRKKDGTIDSVSSGTYTDKQGNTTHLDRTDFIVNIKDYWKSPSTNTSYPSKWGIEIPKLNLNLLIEPTINNQEFDHSFTYWEGAVKVSGGNISGKGYVELTGY